MDPNKLICAYGIFIFAVYVGAQDQSGFISMDCGTPDGSSYNDEKTDVKYVSDAAFVESGISMNISDNLRTSSIEQQFHSVRSFPIGNKNCYTIKPSLGKGFRYLIRTRFMYGNYDGLGNAPEFDLYLGANLWDSIKIDNATTVVTKEIIHLLQTDNIYVCLVKTGSGTPFLSVLELRNLRNDTYESPYESITLFRRWDIGSKTNLPVRYKDDVYDRIWMPLNFNPTFYTQLSTVLTIDSNINNGFQPARSVMSTASARITASDPVIMNWEPKDPKTRYYIYMHFAEVEELQANQTREFEVFLNDNKVLGSVMSPRFLYTDTYSLANPVNGTKLEFTLVPTANSNLPPLINALETYVIVESRKPPTDQQDADAMVNIKTKYKVKKIWNGDPCTPKGYTWDGLNCSYPDEDPPRIISLNLSSSGLTGQIDISFTNLTMIESLDLSNNSFTGDVPNFLSQLQSLRVLNLEGNSLTGFVPTNLLEKSKRGSLLLRVGGNPDLCLTSSCQSTKKKNTLLVPVIASAAALLVLSAVVVLFWFLNRRKKQELIVTSEQKPHPVILGGTGEADGINKGQRESRNRCYSFSELIKITNNFARELGKGGFGKVYYGSLENAEVAVKLLNSTTVEGYKEFQSEVELLMRVHHKNLTSLIGYCDEEGHFGLIYEYMASGTLGEFLSVKRRFNLSWEQRLHISLDAAQGLDYLHSGCTPPIVHRDVKPPNILLNENLRAKIADFGLSRSYPAQGGSHISTRRAGGTPGYLDPECFMTNRPTETNDVYSFGIVLLEVITGQPVIASINGESVNITDRISPLLKEGDITRIIDPSLINSFDSDSAWKITDLALTCASLDVAARPTMDQVVIELRDCLVKEMARRDQGVSGQNRTNPTMLMTVNLDYSEVGPQPR